MGSCVWHVFPKSSGHLWGYLFAHVCKSVENGVADLSGTFPERSQTGDGMSPYRLTAVLALGTSMGGSPWWIPHGGPLVGDLSCGIPHGGPPMDDLPWGIPHVDSPGGMPHGGPQHADSSHSVLTPCGGMAWLQAAHPPFALGQRARLGCHLCPS